MKKLIIMAVSLLLAASAYAQVGVIAGLASNETNVENVDIKGVTQYHIGLAAKLPFILGFGFQPQVIYNVKGQSVGTMIDSENVSFDASTGYFEIPVQIQWGPNILDIARPYVFVEPYLGFALDTKVLKSNTEGKKVEDYEGMTTKDLGMDQWDYGFSVGAGVEFWKLQVSLRWVYDLGSPMDENDKFRKFDDLWSDVKKEFDNFSLKNASSIRGSIVFFF
ncbi:MAG: PorT family protein [Bacteroidales bacterium]|nr:PorT family protein [Bacteroidales bacterium]